MMPDLRREQREYHERQLLLCWKISAAALHSANLKLNDVNLIYSIDLVEGVCRSPLLSSNSSDSVRDGVELVSFPNGRARSRCSSMFSHRD